MLSTKILFINYLVVAPAPDLSVTHYFIQEFIGIGAFDVHDYPSLSCVSVSKNIIYQLVVSQL
jgi:hypothetical protein